MASSTTNLDLISPSQASKEITANALFDATSVSALFGRRATTTIALTWGYYGGVVVVANVLTPVANGTLTLTASAINYLEYNNATGAIAVNTTVYANDAAWFSALTAANKSALYKVVAGAATVTSYVDWRFQGIGAPIVQFPMQYIGTWNASTNTPTLAAGSGTKGSFYVVSVAGTQNLGHGAMLYNANDSVVYNGATWDYIQGSVTSAEIIAALGYTPENLANKDALGGYPSLIGYAVKIWNAGKTFYSSLTLAAGTAANVVHTLQARSGVLADDTDIAGRVSPAQLNAGTLPITATTGTFSGTITKNNPPATLANFFTTSGSTTSAAYANISNTGAALAIGIESSAGLSILPGSTGYSSVLYTYTATDLIFGTNAIVRGVFSGTTGLLTLNNGLAVTGAISSTTTIRSGGYTVATLPAGTTGEECYVTDATTPAWNTALIGGGAVVVGARKNATVWVAF